ncbi:MAG: M20/M25/M40 family metallo-hydrolase, partial [Candidatus Eisenbacteria bacterium]|nr:M20/M25/M40 family metallo-hydrolase [Candidatus Eisenbacteria bacterium]
AEETGQGAARVLADRRFRELRIDRVFALHNLPGFPRGSLIWREGTFAAASRGLWIDLHGATAHAAEPERGRSPAPAVAELIQLLTAIPQQHVPMHAAAKVTVIHVRLGEIAFGTTPGEARVLATLRAYRDEQMTTLAAAAERGARAVAATHGLDVEPRWTEEFPATVNDPESGAIVLSAARAQALDVVTVPQPFAWSEDVGHLTGRYSGALFGLGSGESHPALHHPDYDFPDALLPVGVAIFEAILRKIHG